MSAKKFSPQELLSKTVNLPESARFWVAYSGGMDSHVLLHAFHEIRNEITADIRAVHINHGLSKKSGDWAEHCRNISTDMGIKLEIYKVSDVCPQGESVESWARNQRYDLIRQSMGEGDILFTAQHRDDQAETLLLQLLRGAGPNGLAAMPEIRKFGHGWHYRPLLDFSRGHLYEYALHNRLSWVDDDTNLNLEFDRNFIRQRILPALKERWPNTPGVLSRVSELQAEAANLLDEIAEHDLKASKLPNPFTLSVNGLQELSPSRRRNLIRFWLKQLGMPLPDSRILHQILSNVVYSRYDATPCVSWRGMEVRRYRNLLFARKKTSDSAGSSPAKWDMRESVPTPLGELRAVQSRGSGIRATAVPACQLDIHYRKGGELIQLAGKKHHQSLKKLLQEYSVAPWFRDQIPLLYLDKDLVAVAGFWIDDSYKASVDEESWEIVWDGMEKIVVKD